MSRQIGTDQSSVLAEVSRGPLCYGPANDHRTFGSPSRSAAAPSPTCRTTAVLWGLAISRSTAHFAGILNEKQYIYGRYYSHIDGTISRSLK